MGCCGVKKTKLNRKKASNQDRKNTTIRVLVKYKLTESHDCNK